MNTQRTTGQQMLADVMINGGGTYAVYRGILYPFQPKQGYAVAWDGTTLAMDGDKPVGGDDIMRIAKQLAASFDAEYVGTWLDGQTLYIDVVYYYLPNERTGPSAAIEYAYKIGQLAIYDFGARKSIEVTPEAYVAAYNAQRLPKDHITEAPSR